MVNIVLTLCNETNNNVAYIMIKYLPFRPKHDISKQFECHMITRFNIGAPALLNILNSLGKMLSKPGKLSLFPSCLIYSETCVKWPLSKRSKLIFKTNYRLIQVKSITEWSILQYYRPSLSCHLSLKPLFSVVLSGRFTQVLLYSIKHEHSC